MKSSNNEVKNILMWKSTSNGVETQCEYIRDKKKFKVSASYKLMAFFEMFSCHYDLVNKMNDEDLKESKAIAERLVIQLKELDKADKG